MVNGFLNMAKIFAEAETEADLASTLLETQAVAEEVQQDLQQLKPNVVLETVQGWIPGILSFGYRLIIAALIIFIGMRVIRLVRGLLQSTFSKMGLDVSVGKLLTNVIDAVLYALVIFMAAEKIGIPSASIVALLGSAGLAVGLSLQGSLSNVAGGLLILLMRPFTLGDYISAAGVEGTVQNIGLVYTTLLTVDNRQITVPNGSISNTTITNVSAMDKRRVDVKIGISYSSDIRKAKEIMENVYRSNSAVLADEGITVFVSELADSAVMIGGRGWVNAADYWSVLWDVQERIKNEYDAAGIEIPFNQVDVNIRSMPEK
jgi:small conductance mechanosensitive channel